MRANGGHGILLEGSGASITGNQVGVADGVTPAPNGGDGIRSIGSGATIDGNTVVGHATAVVLDAGNVVGGNELTDNGTGFDVLGDGNSLTGDVVTGTTGVDQAIVVRGQRNRITELSAFDNAGDAIDLLTVQGTPANGDIRTPQVSGATAQGLTLTVAGNLPADEVVAAAANAPLVADVYASRSCFSNNHEAERWLGQVPVTGRTIGGTVATPPVGFDLVTVTVTDEDGDTSELSSCQRITRLAGPDPDPGGGSTTTTSTSTTSTTTGVGAGQVTTSSTASTGAAGRSLPRTGGGVRPWTGVGLVLLGAGLVLVARERTSERRAAGR